MFVKSERTTRTLKGAGNRNKETSGSKKLLNVHDNLSKMELFRVVVRKR
jgi:hypothetical protein